MKTSVLFIRESGEQISSAEMGAVPRIGEQVQIGPNAGPKERLTVGGVVWQAFTDSPVCNSAVVVLG